MAPRPRGCRPAGDHQELAASSVTCRSRPSRCTGRTGELAVAAADDRGPQVAGEEVEEVERLDAVVDQAGGDGEVVGPVRRRGKRRAACVARRASRRSARRRRHARPPAGPCDCRPVESWQQLLAADAAAADVRPHGGVRSGNVHPTAIGRGNPGRERRREAARLTPAVCRLRLDRDSRGASRGYSSLLPPANRIT